MTWALALGIFGALWLKSSVENRSVQDVLRGVLDAARGKGPGESGFTTDLLAEIVNPVAAAVASGADVAGATRPAGAGGGPAQGGSISGVGTYDGKPVAKWIIPWLEKSRAAGWAGHVTSGYRTPEYSESLCMEMCGAPSCPGTCAGRSSNHSGTTYPHGAVDVTDETNFGRIQRQIGSPLRNALPSDRVHFSVSGT